MVQKVTVEKGPADPLKAASICQSLAIRQRRTRLPTAANTCRTCRSQQKIILTRSTIRNLMTASNRCNWEHLEPREIRAILFRDSLGKLKLYSIRQNLLGLSWHS